MSDAKQQSLFETQPLPWELEEAGDIQCAQVVFNRPLTKSFTYLLPDEFRGRLQPGQRVKVPFGRGNRLTVGYCVGLSQPGSTRGLKLLHSIIDRQSLLSPHMLQLSRWIADRYLCGWGQVLDTIIPLGVKKQAGTRMVTLLTLNERALSQWGEANLSAKQLAVVDVLRKADHPLQAEKIAQRAGCGTGPINTLRRKGLIDTVHRRATTFKLAINTQNAEADLVLNAEQQPAFEKILSLLRAGEHKTILLHGVTGSGKTEIYIQAIREVVGYGRQAIVLVPEISLTPQTIRRFRGRFQSVAVLHSHLSDAERHAQWQQIAGGNVQVVVGARSAVFAPTPHLGLIVIDEEHETTFKQETAPRYHAREVARKRAELESVPLLLGSATPTLESWQRTRDGMDILLQLTKRVNGLPMPPVVVVDIRHDPRCMAGASIGRAMQVAMRSALEAGGQVILFLNVRGHSPVLWCRACGEGIKCPHCDITLTWHKARHIALCHTCDFATNPLSHCPRCGHAGVRYFGAGTQRLEEEVQAKFRGFGCLRMDSDTMGKPGSYDTALEAFRTGEADILLGTQMIAKGLDFPNVTLVGVIDADTILHQPDIRATERTFQLIAQVAGRAGRSSKGGRVFVQTSSPAELAIRTAANHDYEGFVQVELKHRRELLVPPFRHLTRIILRGPKESEVKAEATQIADLLRDAAEQLALSVRILGPAPAVITKIKKNYRYHLQLSATKLEEIEQLWHSVTGKLPRSAGVAYVIDVDPLNMR